ncbi:MAG: BrnT family toxin [Spirochaetaceae bacterium]|nr:BrnT family toxin [Spirochaetaceae bacterium]
MDNRLRFVWDETKNKENLKKHGIDFNTAIFVFNDPNHIKIYDEAHSIDEERWNIIGMINDVVLFVVETEMTDNLIRIISARKANKNERETYNGKNNIS